MSIPNFIELAQLVWFLNRDHWSVLRVPASKRAGEQASKKLFLQQNRQISKSQKIWTSPNFGMRFTALSSEWLGDSKSIGFLGVADREVLKKWRRKWRFSQTELVGYILPRAVGRFPPKFGRGGERGGDDRYRGRWIEPLNTVTLYLNNICKFEEAIVLMHEPGRPFSRGRK